ncbi:MAG TPA: hypothetical protein ENN80_11145 [Candidatus Hydrogenedentes bacterium]|nr:hypothetical protein [Candidatus Hydrogenedentota bacterium]
MMQLDSETGDETRLREVGHSDGPSCRQVLESADITDEAWKVLVELCNQLYSVTFQDRLDYAFDSLRRVID